MHSYLYSYLENQERPDWYSQFLILYLLRKY